MRETTRWTQEELTEVAIKHWKKMEFASTDSSTGAKPLVLDVGCGSALSTDYFLRREELPFAIGCDISRDMLLTGVGASKNNKTKGRVVERVMADFTRKLPFR